MVDWCRCRSDDGQASLLRVTRAAFDLIAADPPDQHGSGVEIQGRAFIDSSATLESTTVRGPVVVGAGSHISSALIGPYTSIGDHGAIEGSESRTRSCSGVRASPTCATDSREASLGRRRGYRSHSTSPRRMPLTLGEGAEAVLS